MNRRAEALKWWRSLPFETQSELIVKHFGNIEQVMIRTSTSKIQQIFEKETNLPRITQHGSYMRHVTYAFSKKFVGFGFMILLGNSL